MSTVNLWVADHQSELLNLKIQTFQGGVSLLSCLPGPVYLCSSKECCNRCWANVVWAKCGNSPPTHTHTVAFSVKQTVNHFSFWGSRCLMIRPELTSLMKPIQVAGYTMLLASYSYCKDWLPGLQTSCYMCTVMFIRIRTELLPYRIQFFVSFWKNVSVSLFDKYLLLWLR